MPKYTFIAGLFAIFALAADASVDPSPQEILLTAEYESSFALAETKGRENRTERRDERPEDRNDRGEDRQDCRQTEGAGDDKRDCKQDERQERNEDG